MPLPLIDAAPTPTPPQGHAWRERHDTLPAAAATSPSTATPEDDSVTHSVSADDLPVWHATDTLPLTAAIAHELRTPLHGLLGTLELLQKTSLTTHQHALLRVGSDATAALMRIANDVLDFTKLRTTQPSLRVEPCDLRRLIDDLIMLLDAQARRAGVLLESQVDAMLAPSVMTDQVRLRQVLLNLMTNALKFTDVGRILIRVTVSANDATAEPSRAPPIATVRTTPPSLNAAATARAAEASTPPPAMPSSMQQSIVIEVIDTGIGIPAAALAAIWRPFVQVDAHVSRNREGSGLGLSIAKLMASRLGCTLTLDSEVGVGTTARLSARWPVGAQPSAPIHDAPACGHDHVAPTESKGPAARDATLQTVSVAPISAHILVVDDHPTTRLILRAQLGALGHRVRLAEDAEAALALLRQRRFDLMLTDCKMPGRDGLALAAAWRHAEGVGALPMRVVGLTANPLPNLALQQPAAGFDACLVKPVTLQTLERLCDIRPSPTRPPAGIGNDAERSSAALDPGERSIFAAARAHRPSTPRRPPLDLPRIAEMFGCAATLDRVLTSFATATLEDLRKIDTALRDNRPAIACQRPLHRLTGGLQVLGCHALANLGAMLEQALVTPIGRASPAARERVGGRGALGTFGGSAHATPHRKRNAANHTAALSMADGAGGAAVDSPHDKRLKRRLHAFGVQVALCLDWLARQRIR
ncbi:ATP-binding protein [Robbsia sp. KACC 23696]|uniref:ATP-binding protein n=1 Tax=Robbsia sp. KACC 23696 TaxID=3149231 RepID=UPI00325A83E2